VELPGAKGSSETRGKRIRITKVQSTDWGVGQRRLSTCRPMHTFFVNSTYFEYKFSVRDSVEEN
jgi:hypothetical protein